MWFWQLCLNHFWTISRIFFILANILIYFNDLPKRVPKENPPRKIKGIGIIIKGVPEKYPISKMPGNISRVSRESFLSLMFFIS